MTTPDLDKRLLNMARDKGLEIREKNGDYPVFRDGEQIRYFFNIKSLTKFIAEYDKEEFDRMRAESVSGGDTAQNSGARVPYQPDTTGQRRQSGPQRVVVTDINMPFGSMVSFMVKWAIASIPAIIILIVLFSLSTAILSAMLGGVLSR